MQNRGPAESVVNGFNGHCPHPKQGRANPISISAALALFRNGLTDLSVSLGTVEPSSQNAGFKGS